MTSEFAVGIVGMSTRLSPNVRPELLLPEEVPIPATNCVPVGAVFGVNATMQLTSQSPAVSDMVVTSLNIAVVNVTADPIAT
jgi:hypothetical protein